MYETVNVPSGANGEGVVVLINGDTVLFCGLGFAPTITAETALVPETENETACPAQTGFGEAITVPEGGALTVTLAGAENVHPLASLPTTAKLPVPAVVGVIESGRVPVFAPVKLNEFAPVTVMLGLAGPAVAATSIEIGVPKQNIDGVAVAVPVPSAKTVISGVVKGALDPSALVAIALMVNEPAPGGTIY